jgi:hypothetical protein
MAVSVASGFGGGKFDNEKRRVFAASTTLDCDPDLPDNLVPFVRKMLAANRSRVRALAWQFRPGNRALKRGAFRCWLAESRGSSHFESRRRVGHHGGDAASVLGTVQGAALRSARAYARPSGLDGACAQMIRGQLRDGRRMLLPFGTHDASMDPLDSIEERSRVFDPFRTRAIRPLVEVHLSRF